MQKKWGISRALAEQEVNWCNSDLVGYMAAQTPERQRNGPPESSLKAPMTNQEVLLASVWGVASICILIFFALKIAKYEVSYKPIIPQAENDPYFQGLRYVYDQLACLRGQCPPTDLGF